MFSITQRAVLSVSERLGKALMEHPDLLSHMENSDVASSGEPLETIRKFFGELFDILQKTLPIDDPEVKRVHGLILQSFQIPIMLGEELLSGSHCLVHLFYGALKEEERLGGQKVLFLNRERVDELLLDFFHPLGKTVAFKIDRAEVDALVYILNLILPRNKFSNSLYNHGVAVINEMETALIYPLFVLLRLLNDAACQRDS